MSPKIYICDFNDSFTFNIYSTLKDYNQNLDIEVIPLKRLLNFLQVLYDQQNKCAVILGPGPGHPDEYDYLYSSIKKLLPCENIFFLGVCLGHQLIWRLQGEQVDYCTKPEHGQVVEYSLTKNLSKTLDLPTKIAVQRYNSLSVKLTKRQVEHWVKQGWQLHLSEGELIISFRKNILSYQFHPESIGTTCPESYFGPLLQFLV